MLMWILQQVDNADITNYQAKASGTVGRAPVWEHPLAAEF
jgi:hypothetical protein